MILEYKHMHIKQMYRLLCELSVANRLSQLVFSYLIVKFFVNKVL